jgi:YbbR domain-containing protein
MSRPNIPILLLSIVLSCFLWVVRFGQNLTTSGQIPVKLPISNVIGLSSKLSVSNIQGFKLQLSGPAEDVAKAETETDVNNLITVDLTSARPGSFYYPLQFSASIRRLVDGPKNVLVDIEEIETKEVPIVVDLKGKLKDASSRLDSYPTSEHTATITAPKHIADAVTAVRAVLNLNQIDTANPQPQDAVLVPIDAKNVTYDATTEPARVTITPIVMAAQIRKNIVISPVIQGVPAAGFIPKGAKLTPNVVEVAGPTSTLNNLFSVKTEPIDINNLDGTKWFVVKLLLPAGTSSPTKSIHVRYDIAPDPAIQRIKTAKTGTVSSTPKTGTGP